VRLKEHIATQLASALADRVRLGSKPTVIQAPPSQVADYPTIAVWIENTVEDLSFAFPVLVDSLNNPLVGSALVSEAGDILDGPAMVLGGGVTLTSIGTVHCTGRIWVGSRYPGKREEVEEGITFAFNQDDAAPGRLMLSLAGYQLGEHTIHFGFAAADLNESRWVGEHAFEARLWSWRPFAVDAPLQVPRTDPLTQRLILEISHDLKTEINEPADVAKLQDLEKYTHDENGNLVTTTL